MISILEGVQTIPFPEIMDPETGRTKVRTVDILYSYEVARSYMIRLEKKIRRRRDAYRVSTANLSKEEFKAALVK